MLPQIPTAILDSPAPWLALAGLGIYHGLNPAMGWLFALALGLQQRSARAIWRALAAVVAGHAASVVAIAGLLLVARAIVPLDLLRLLTAAVLVLFGLWKFFTYYRHPRWVGMRVSGRELAGWSFLMATAHGAGLMVAPVLLAMPGVEPLVSLHHHGSQATLTTPQTSALWGLAIGVHTGTMLVTMAALAWIVYRWVGLAVLRRSWVNFDLIWAVALLVAGGFAFAAALTA